MKRIKPIKPKRRPVVEKEFAAYLEVQNSGVTNMFDIKVVSTLSGLPEEKIKYIMRNYTECLRDFPNASGWKNHDHKIV